MLHTDNSVLIETTSFKWTRQEMLYINAQRFKIVCIKTFAFLPVHYGVYWANGKK